ncbi:MAG: YhjD/YihY/BrkB family envelope integrity protein [Candidatus Latescibacteria bacterium]|nr:YhjD/YihY/BrkB family envelope integrity protein [Candidatus Latescibacterota bacterium]
MEESGERLKSLIQDNLVSSLNLEATNYIDYFFDNVHSGAIAGVGVPVLLLTVLFLIEAIEAAFNNIWGVEHSGPFLEKLTAFWAVITLGPVLLSASLWMTGTVQRSHPLDSFPGTPERNGSQTGILADSYGQTSSKSVFRPSKSV